METQQVHVTLLATAGVLVAAGAERFLIDGIIREEGHPFSPVPRAELETLTQGRPPFDSIGYLFITHLHPDHFDCDKTMAFLENNRVRRVFLPFDDSRERMREDGARLKRYMVEHGVPFRLLNVPVGESCRYALEDGTELTAFNTGHMGPQYGRVNNYCFLVKAGGKTLLFTGDSDFLEDGYRSALDGQGVDAVFVNPLFYQNPQGRRLVSEVIRPRQAILYHVPFAGEDKMGVRRMVKMQLERYQSDAFTLYALTEPGQTVSV